MYKYTHSLNGGVRKLNGINNTLFTRERTVYYTKIEKGYSLIILKTSDNAKYIL
jgi:hypothetical protein